MSRRTLPGTIATRPPAFGVTRLKPVPAFAALVGFLLLIGMIQSFYVGSAGSFRDLGGPVPRGDMPPQCIALTYAAPGNFEWLPDTLRLTPEVDFRFRFGTWYRAFGHQGYREDWRPAGRDSIDISGHHKPVTRIPARGAHRVGRGGWYGHQTVWAALTSRSWRVDAREVACGGDEPGKTP